MTLTLEELEDIQAEYMADDVAIELERMSLWTSEKAHAYFESGGVEPPDPPKASWTQGGATPTGATPWLKCVQKKPDAKFRLVVFSWTGNRGGYGSAHSLVRGACNWSQSLEAFEIYEVALPGRGTRMKDKLVTSTPAMVEQMAAALGPALAGGSAYGFVGFSFGAILAWEVAIAIGQAGAGEGPALVCAVSAEGPSWRGRASTLHTLGAKEFEDELRKKGGTDVILKDPGMTKMYLPVIKADIELEGTYAPPPKGKVTGVPVFAFAGAKPGKDKEKTTVPPDAARLWLAASADGERSRFFALDDCDWYVFLDEAGCRAVHTSIIEYFAAL